MQERGVAVEHATVSRWALKDSPQLEAAFHRRTQPVWRSWRRDETSVRVKGHWRYVYRAADKTGQALDRLLTEQRDEPAATRSLAQAVRRHGVPETVTIGGSEANAAAIRGHNEAHGTDIAIRHVAYLTNMVEQDHRSVERGIRPMPGFTSLGAAQGALVGSEPMPMLQEGPSVVAEGEERLTPAEQLDAPAA